MALTREDLQAIGELLDEKLEKKFEEKLSPIEKRLTSVEGKVNSVEEKLDSLSLHVENVTDRNIQTVAEGHLDLSRKLDDALRVENEKEMLIIRVRILEDELRKVKDRLDKLDQIA